MTAARIIIAPDSFKGSLSAAAAAEAIGRGLGDGAPNAECVLAPMADGGEGTLDCVAAVSAGHWRRATLTGVHDQALDALWYVTRDGLHVLESATVLGLPLIETEPRAPALSQRSSAPLGELLLGALDDGAESIAVGLGGSACNDAGLGLLVALGAHAVDADGRPVSADMAGLCALAQLDTTHLDPRLATADIRVLCDVDNPLLGTHGASRVYGPQKGLTDADIEAVEAGFTRLAASLDAMAVAERAGSGAAGGLGFALAALGGRLESGANALLALTGLDTRLRQTDLVVTGEGRSDHQTLTGKTPLAVARAAAPTSCLLVAGDIDPAARAALDAAFAACYSLTERAGSATAALAEPARWLVETGAAIGRSLARA